MSKFPSNFESGFQARVTMDELGGEIQVEEEEKVQEQEEKARLITQVIFL